MFLPKQDDALLTTVGASSAIWRSQEVYSALDAGTLDGAEVDLPLAASAPLGTFSHINEINYRALVSVVVANRALWHELPERAQIGLVQAAQNVASELIKSVEEHDVGARSILAARQVAFVTPSTEGMDAFKRVSADTWRATRPPELADFFDSVVAYQRALAAGDESRPSQTIPDRRGAAEVEVLFATDRNYERGHGNPVFGSKRITGQMYCGAVRVGLHPDRPAATERAYFFNLAPFTPTPWGPKGAACKALVAERLKSAAEPGMLLFVHGFNNSFAAAIRRAASLAYDIDYRGLVGIWSWPSAASIEDYKWDDTSVQWTRGNLRKHLRLLAEVDGLKHVNIVAHSMGNRVLLDTLEPINAQASGLVPLLDDIIFVAPDVASDVFEKSIPEFAALAERLTLYASDDDWALWFSQLWHHGGQSRAGQGGPNIVVADDLQSIDVVDLGDFTRHAYVFNSQIGVKDVGVLIVQDLDARARGLLEQPKGRLSYWLLGRAP